MMRYITKTKLYAQYLFAAVFTIVPIYMSVWWITEVFVLARRDADIPVALGVLAVILGLVFIGAGLLTLMFALMFFWIWVFDIPGESQRTHEKEEIEYDPT